MCVCVCVCVCERDTDTDTDTWFIVKATDPYTRLELGGGRWGRR